MIKNAFDSIMKIHNIVFIGGPDDASLQWSLEIDAALQPVTYRKRGAPVNLSQVSKAYNSAPGIPADKKSDLISIIPHLSQQSMARIYCNSLPVLDHTEDIIYYYSMEITSNLINFSVKNQLLITFFI